MEEKPPEKLTLKTSGIWLQEFHRAEGNRNSTLSWLHPRSSVHQDQREKRSELLRHWARTTSIRGSPTKVGDGCGSLQGKKTLAVVALVTTHWRKPFQRLPSPRPSPTQQPVGLCSDASSQTTNRIVTQPHPLANKQLPEHGPTHQRDKTQQWAESRPSHQEACQRLLDNLFYQREDRRRKNYNPESWGRETVVTER